MSEQPGGFDLVRSYALVMDDDYEAARALLGDLRVNQKATVALLPVIAWAVGHQRREAVRTVERKARVGLRSVAGLGDHDVVGARKELLEATFATPSGRVLWRLATVEQHRERIAYMRVLRDGYNADIKAHEDAIAAIVAAGVSCLGEIEGWAA